MSKKKTQFDEIEFVKILKKVQSLFLPHLQEVFENSAMLLNNRVQVVFPNYTLHDINHSIRVANYMYEIVKHKINIKTPNNSIQELDIVIMLYSAILHDIGMVVNEKEIEQIKADNYQINNNQKCHIQLSGIKNLDWIKCIESGEEQNKYAIQEYIRRIHGLRAVQYIKNVQLEDNDYFVIPDFSTSNFHEDLALICQSHNESFDWIKKKLKKEKTKGDYTYNPQFCACILRLADILDIDERRTPQVLFESVNPQGFSNEEWLQHKVIQNAKKIKLKEGQINFKFTGECSDAKIHRKIYQYLDWVKDEIIGVEILMKTFQPNYILNLNASIIREIESKGDYTIPDNKISINYRAVSTLLVGDKIYGDRKYGLRELLQNSIDACNLRYEIESKGSEIGRDEHKSKIKIIIDESRNEFRIKDNGIGMTIDVINKHFLSIGKSYYRSDNFKIANYNYQPIGTFGIGFLACFMLSKKIKIKTRYFNSDALYEIELEQGEEYSCIRETKDINFEGTEIILDCKEVMSVFHNVDFVKSFLKSNFLIENIAVNLYENHKDSILDLTFDKGYEPKIETEINISEYLNDIEGFIVTNNKLPLFKTIADFENDDIIFYCSKTKTINSNQAEFNSTEITQLTKDNILEYFILQYDTEDDYSMSEYSHQYYILYDNNLDESHNVKSTVLEYFKIKVSTQNIGKYFFDIEKELRLHKMKIYNDNKTYKYNISYYSELTNKNDPYIYDYYNLCRLSVEHDVTGNVFNNGINVPKENITKWWTSENQTLLTGLKVKRCSLNLKPGLELNVSRDCFYNPDDIKTLSFAIHKAAHKAYLDNNSLDDDRKEVLKSFIDRIFSEKTKYCTDKK